MRYELQRDVIDSTGRIPLSEEEYSNLVSARLNLRFPLYIEEQFDLLLENYVEFENDLLSIAVRKMVAFSLDYESTQRERNLVVNRRLLNLLSASRGYLDHAPQHINAIEMPQGELAPITSADFDRYRNTQYDTFVEYRTMEALRNYTQHSGFPLAAIYGFGWLKGDDAESQLRFGATPYIDVAMLGKRFKAQTRKELEKMGEKVSLMPMVRQYVASLGTIHEQLRKALRLNVGKWDKTVLGAIERFKKAYPDEKAIGLFAVKIAEEGRKAKEKTELYAKSLEYRHALEQRNRNFGTLPRRYVSSEST